jgi:hypothetical protein
MRKSDCHEFLTTRLPGKRLFVVFEQPDRALKVFFLHLKGVPPHLVRTTGNTTESKCTHRSGAHETYHQVSEGQPPMVAAIGKGAVAKPSTGRLPSVSVPKNSTSARYTQSVDDEPIRNR